MLYFIFRLRARAMRKKKSTKKRSILDRTGAATGLQRARLMTLNFNNAFEYARELGIERDSIDILERQFMYSEITLKEALSKLRLGLEVCYYIIYHGISLYSIYVNASFLDSTAIRWTECNGNNSSRS